MSDTSRDTIVLDLAGNFPSEAQRSATSADHLAESLGKFQAASDKVKDPQWLAAGKLNAARSEMERIADVNARIAAFDPVRTRELAKQEALLKQMRNEALGVQQESAKTNDVAGLVGANLGGWGTALRMAKDAAVAVYDKVVELRREAQAFIGEWGGFGAKMAIDATSRRELQGGIGSRLGGSFTGTVREALKIGVDPDAAWEMSKKLLSDKFSQEEIPGILKIKAGMDLAGQNGEALITELQKLKLEPKIKSADIDRLYKMGIDSKAVYSELAKTLGTDVATAQAKVKAGAVDTEAAIKAIEKVAKDKFGGFADLLGNTIPSLIARVKREAEDMFDTVDVSPVKNLLKDILADIDGPQGRALKAGIADLFGSVFRTDITGGGGKKTIDELFAAMAKGAHDAAAAVRSLQPVVDRLLATLKQMERGGALKQLIDVGKDAAQKKIEETQDKARATQAQAKLSNRGAGGLLEDFLDPTKSIWTDLAETSETYQKLKRGAKGIRKSLGTETAEDIAEDKALGENKIKPAADKLPVLLNGDAQHAAAMDAGNDIPAGMAEGIEAGASQAISAAEKMAGDSLQAAKDKLGIHSPSDAFGEEVGDMSAEGMARNMAAHPGPEAAGRQMAANALGAAQGVAGAAGATGASAAGGGVVYNITMGAGASDADLARLEAMLRRVDRARAEGGMLPAFA